MGSTSPGSGRLNQIAITGMGVTTALGRGSGPLLDGVLSGQPAFKPVTRFRTDRCRASAAAELLAAKTVEAELAAVIADACAMAGLDQGQRAAAEFGLALHTNPEAARDPTASNVNGGSAAEVARLAGLRPPARIYVAACVAASTAIADAAAMISTGRADTAIVAAGFLVDADTFGVFDAGRALARDGSVRPFSAGRQGLLLGDGAAAVVLESAAAARHRDARVLGWLAGWGRAGDAFDVCQPHPAGRGLAAAIGNALRRAGADVTDVGYVNANGTGTAFADASESAALHLALGGEARQIPVSSTKSVHGHALEASALIEFVATLMALRARQLPVNAGFLSADPQCELDLVLRPGREPRPGYGLSLNAAFGGANTALLVAVA
jgi:3-oxoacyl-(acyl-carrier-protein) synthase